MADTTGYTVEGCWRQVGGGCRYLVRGPEGVEVTVSVKDGRVSGFVRGPARPDEDEILEAAFALMDHYAGRGLRGAY